MFKRLTPYAPSIFLFTVIFIGGLSFLAYIGVPIHQVLFLTETEIRALDPVCGTKLVAGMFLCRAPYSLLPFFGAFLQTLWPFIPYIIISVLALGAIMFIHAYKTGEWSREMMLRPITLLGCFIVSVWLFGTTFSMGTLHNLRLDERYLISDLRGNPILPPFNRFYEPKAELYPNVGEQGMQALTDNFHDLQARGCLKPLTKDGQELQTRTGSRIFTYSPLCAQQALFTRVLPHILLLALFTALFLAIGRTVRLRVCQHEYFSKELQAGIDLTLGALIVIMTLWTLSLFGAFTLTPILISLTILGLISYRSVESLFHDLLRPSLPLSVNLTSTSLFLGWLLISYIALNFLNVIRPFPIGWDDLGVYMNMPRLLASYGSFIAQLCRFQWEYITALGFAMFGYDSFFGATLSMQLNWLLGPLSTFAVYSTSRIFFSRRASILSALLFTITPVIGHFSFADMKIDNATFFTSVIAIALSLELIKQQNNQKRWWLLCGALLSFSFAIKATAILSLLLVLFVISTSFLGGFGSILGMCASIALLALYGPLNLSDILHNSGIGIDAPRLLLPSVAIGIMAIIGMILFMRKERHEVLQAWGIASGSLMIGFLLTFLPWGMHNAWVNQNISFSSMLGAQDLRATKIFLTEEQAKEAHADPRISTRTLPEELKLDPTHPACTTSAKAEELDRYWGFSKNWSHYTLLFWRQIMNIDSVGYYVTLYPALFLLPLLLLVPAFWSNERRLLRILMASMLLMYILWMFVGNGVIWYGITLFLGFSIGLTALVSDAPSEASKRIMQVFIVLSIIICLSNRLLQFDSQRNSFEYPLGKTSALIMQETTVMHYDNIRDEIVKRHEEMPETPFSLRIGTFIPYFVPRNREIIPVADNQLGLFSCINQEKDHALTVKRLKALGFNSIIFDTNAATIEDDKNGTLHQKVQAFVDFANDQSIALEIPIYDPGDGLAFVLLP